MIESNTNIVRYDGDGATVAFDYPFLIFQSTDLKVYVDGSLVANSNYSVSGVGVEAGGTVTFSVAPAVGDENVILEREALFTQPVSIQEGSKFPASVVEAAHDRNVMLSQQLDTRVKRCIQIGVTDFAGTDSTTIASNASERALKVIAFNSTGTGMTLVDGGGTAEAEIWAQAAAQSAANAANSANSASNALNTINAIVAGLQDQINAAISGFVTGDMKLTWRPSPTTGWVFMNDGTIGSATSGATTRANADTETLYTLFWNNYDDELIPVTGGRGANAAADFSANKPMRLPLVLGRALYAAGIGKTVAIGGDSAVDISLNTIAVNENVDTWVGGMEVVFTLSSGSVTGLTSGNTYYIIRSSSTAVQLASTLLNAQNGTAIDFTAKSSPVWTLTHTYASREAGGFFGEQHHAPATNEVAPHAHPHTHGIPSFGGAGDGATRVAEGGSSLIGDAITKSSAVVTGGGARVLTSSPGVACNVAVKL